MNQPNVAPAEALKWLVCLTDGDDLGSRRENARGEIVNQMLHAGIPSNLNMVMITVGSLRAGNVKVIDSWVEKVSSTGGLGRHVSEKDAAAIAKAFDVVAECLATEVGGATEC
uniref:VWFA domain-containing protein n=1 Tax=Alexandrium andersonii TaxID=327968 RepID=A0A7S2G0E3_9DINO